MRSLLLGLLAASTAIVAPLLPAHAQDNKLTILQSGAGNTLFVDQTKAQNSTVGGLKLNGGSGITLTEQAEQLGGNNAANIAIEGDGGNVYLFQNNTAGASGPSNTATINARGGGSALVAQDGTNNRANLTVQGSLTQPTLMVGAQPIHGAIIQRGADNVGTVVTGPQSDGLLVQNGSNNQAALDIAASAPGTNVVFTQNGSNLNSATAAQVFTTAVGGTVSVTQTGFGSVTTQGAVTVNQTAR
jgi:hypothetical protein